MSIDIQQYNFTGDQYVLISVATGRMSPMAAKKRLDYFKKNSSLCEVLTNKGIRFDVMAVPVTHFENYNPIKIEQQNDDTGKDSLADIKLPEDIVTSLGDIKDLDVTAAVDALDRHPYVIRVQEQEQEQELDMTDRGIVYKPRSNLVAATAFDTADRMVNSMHYFSPYIFSLDELEEESEAYRNQVNFLKEVTKQADKNWVDFWKLSDSERLSLEQSTMAWPKKMWCGLAGVPIPLTKEQKIALVKEERDQELRDLVEAHASMQKAFDERISELEEQVKNDK